ncbi:MAG TPA: hypothetical protein VGE59_03085 [Patescibacteria group bacterium]
MKVLVIRGDTTTTAPFLGLRNGKPIQVIPITRLEEVEYHLRLRNTAIRVVIDPSAELFTPTGETEARVDGILQAVRAHRKRGIFFIERYERTDERVKALMEQHPGVGYISVHPTRFLAEVGEQLGLHT